MSAAFGDGSHRINLTNGLLLYYHNYSYYSQKVLMALYEKNLPFESQLVHIERGGQYESWFLKLNPRGEVPVLQDTGKIIPDSARIIDYLEDNFSNGDTPRLIPMDQGAEIRQTVTHFRQIIDQLPVRTLTMGSLFHSEFVDNPKLPFVGPVRRVVGNAEKNIGVTLRRHAENNPEAREVLLQKAAIHDQKSSVFTNREEYIEVVKQFEGVLFEVESELANHTEERANWWLCSDRFTVADIALTVLLERLNQLGYESRFWKDGKRPHIEKYYAKVKQRDSYKKVIPTAFVHFQMFLNTYRTPLIIGLGISVVAAIAVIVGGVYLIRSGGNSGN